MAGNLAWMARPDKLCADHVDGLAGDYAEALSGTERRVFNVFPFYLVQLLLV